MLANSPDHNETMVIPKGVQLLRGDEVLFVENPIQVNVISQLDDLNAVIVDLSEHSDPPVEALFLLPETHAL